MSVHVLGEVEIADLDRFVEVFGTEGLDKRREHGSVGATVFSPSDDPNRVVVLLEFADDAAFEGFRADETAPPIMRKGGAQGPPVFRKLERVAELDA